MLQLKEGVVSDDIAIMAHTLNAEWCLINGDDSQPTWDDAPQWQKDSARNGVRFHIENYPSAPEDSHNNWMAEKVADGWVYGETKDPEAKTHPCIVPYEELPAVQRLKDSLFIAVVHACCVLPD